MCNKPHVFLNERSCQTVLITFYDGVLLLLDKSNDVKEIFWDFREANDRVSHTKE